MVLSGLVVQVCRATNTGIIEATGKNGKTREFFFNIDECVDSELPKLYSTVSFFKHPDFKSTDVAAGIVRSKVFSNVG